MSEEILILKNDPDAVGYVETTGRLRLLKRAWKPLPVLQQEWRDVVTRKSFWEDVPIESEEEN